MGGGPALKARRGGRGVWAARVLGLKAGWGWPRRPLLTQRHLCITQRRVSGGLYPDMYPP